MHLSNIFLCPTSFRHCKQQKDVIYRWLSILELTCLIMHNSERTLGTWRYNNFYSAQSALEIRRNKA